MCRRTAAQQANITALFYPGTTALRFCACARHSTPSNSPSASRRGVNSTELRSWRMAEEMLYGEFGFALGLPPAQVRDYLREKLGG